MTTDATGTAVTEEAAGTAVTEKAVASLRASADPRLREPCEVSGRVSSRDGTPQPGAVLDVWQADAEGHFWFRICVPAPYPIPIDGPVGELLRETGRHPYRPAHIHFIATAADHTPVTTRTFVAGSGYLDSDAVFAVRKSLAQDFAVTDNPSLAREFGGPIPFRHARFDLVLERAT